ncbi:MAG TPA: nitroreductase family protein [Candidatus Limnocylindria bacterium]|nr:nitroreductase family protein [Candidatus Limnocylindria bacterium]
MSVDVRGSIGTLIRTRRAVRKFKPGLIPDADVNEILEAARWAPSPANRQPARFIWVKSGSVKRELQELAKESKELSAYWDPIFRADGASGLVNDLETPEVIAVIADPTKSLTNVHADNRFEWAAAMSIYAMWLRAYSLGYGGVFVQHWITEKAKKILNVPLSWTFLGTFTFGHPAEAPTIDRLPLDQLVYVDRYPGRPRP